MELGAEMKKNLKVIVMFLSMLGFFLPRLAECGQYSGNFKIIEMHLDENQGAWYLWIKPDVAVVNPGGVCGRTDFYVLPMDYPYSKERYAMLLAAYSAHKNVQVYISGCVLTAPADWPLVDQSRLTISD